MAWIQIVNIPNWSVQDVQEWMKGLDDDLQCYCGNFEDNQIVGSRLLSMNTENLEDLHVNKIGHQELLLEAIGLLNNLNYNLPTETLQSVTLGLSCSAKHLHSVVTRRQQDRDTQENHACFDVIGLKSDVLTFVTYVITAAKLLISWLDRPPFASGGEYFTMRQKVLEHVMKLNSFSQLTGDVAIVERAILTTSNELLVLSEEFIKNGSDPLTIQPAYIELVTLRKSNPEVELGLYIMTSTLDGIHYIKDTKRESPAYLNQKIHPGDEVLQINKQTVVGWNHTKLIGALKADKSGVVLTLKKRPCNLKAPGHVIHSRRWAGKNFTPSGNYASPIVKMKPSAKSNPVKPDVPTVEDKSKDRLERNNGRPTKCIDNDQSSGNEDESDAYSVKLVKRHQGDVESGTVYQSLDEVGETKYDGYEPTPIDLEIDTKTTNTTKQEVKEQNEMEVSIPDKPGLEIGSHDNPEAPPEPEITSMDAFPDSSLSTKVEKEEEKEEKDKEEIQSIDNAEIIQEESNNLPTMEPDTREPPEVHQTDIYTSSRKDRHQNVSFISTSSDASSVITTSSSSSSLTSLQVKLRPKKGPGILRSHKDRHVSCVELGPGQCEGWLDKKSETRFGSKWSPVWCVLKDLVFYYYKSKKDLKAKGMICLVGYEVKAEENKKLNVFKVGHKGLKPFLFAAERLKDMNMWIEKLGLISVMFNEPEDAKQTEHTELGHIAEGMTGYQSESDDEGSVCMGSQDESDGKPVSSDLNLNQDSEDDVLNLYNVLVVGNGVEIKGFNRSTRSRSSQKSRKTNDKLYMRLTVLNKDPTKNRLLLKKRALQRTCKVKRTELEAIVGLLSGPLTSESVQEWKEQYNSILLKDEHDTSSEGELTKNHAEHQTNSKDEEANNNSEDEEQKDINNTLKKEDKQSTLEYKHDTEDEKIIANETGVKHGGKTTEDSKCENDDQLICEESTSSDETRSKIEIDSELVQCIRTEEFSLNDSLLDNTPAGGACDTQAHPDLTDKDVPAADIEDHSTIITLTGSETHL